MQAVPAEPHDPAADGPVTRESAGDSVRAWVAAWGAEVARVDLEAGRRRFHPDAVAFGTHADVVSGVDRLHDQQWSAIWPNITGFAFRDDDMVTSISPDGLHAVAVVTWDSTGYDRDGQPFDRPGRATIVLRRDTVSDDWLCVHTHFSLARGVPSETHGHPDTRREPR